MSERIQQRYITVYGRRYDLTGMVEIDCSHRERHGVSLIRAWYGPRSHRLIVESYSIWDCGDGRIRGTIYDIYEPGNPAYDMAVEYCEREGGIFPAGVPVTVIEEPKAGDDE